MPLSYVADIRSVTGPNTINRENVQRKIVISANVSERDLRSVVNEIQDRVEANIRLPEGYHIEYVRAGSRARRRPAVPYC